MKKQILPLAFMLVTLFLPFLWNGQGLVAQNIAITDDDSYTANPSAMLDVKSLTKGMLIPRLTTAQRTAVVTPATGLLVFDTDAGSFYFYNGTSWLNLTSGNANGIWSYTSPDKVYLTDTYDKLGVGTATPFGKMEVKSDLGLGTNDPIFQVINNNGDTVFAVYQQGVRINVEDGVGKATASKGGFAVGGFSPAKGTFTNEFLRVTPDSVRIYIEDDPAKATGNKGGFAVGGFSPAKTTATKYMDMSPVNYFIGHESGININVVGGGNYNNFFGYQAGKFNTTGYRNNAIGYNALFTNTSGYDNVANGYQALYNNTIGYDNVANGVQSLFSNTTGNLNTAEGYQAMYRNTTGYTNVGIGNLALWNNTTGSANVAIGDQSMYYAIGSTNTAVGQWSLFYNTGNNNTALGFGAYFSWSQTNYTNSTAIGNTAMISASNQVRIGNNSVTSIGGYAAWTNLSDGRFKKDITETVPGLDFIMKLRPVNYHLDIAKLSEYSKLPDSLRNKDSEKIKSEMLQTGFIAQEVEEATKSVGFDFSGVDKPKNENDYYGLRYAEFTVPLVKAVQEQQAIINDLKSKNVKMEFELQTNKNQVEDLKVEVENLKSLIYSSSKK